jgi:hypothetical protein
MHHVFHFEGLKFSESSFINFVSLSIQETCGTVRDIQGMEENKKVHDEIQNKCQENLNMKLLEAENLNQKGLLLS